MLDLDHQLSGYASVLDDHAAPITAAEAIQMQSPIGHPAPAHTPSGRRLLFVAATILAVVATAVAWRVVSGERGGEVRTGTPPMSDTAPRSAKRQVSTSGWKRTRISPSPVTNWASVLFQGKLYVGGRAPGVVPGPSGTAEQHPLFTLSPDGTWTEVANVPVAMTRMATDGRSLVIIDGSANAWLTTDMISWRKVDDGNLLLGTQRDIAASDRGFVIVGSDSRKPAYGAYQAAIWYSKDGTSFERIGDPPVLSVDRTLARIGARSLNPPGDRLPPVVFDVVSVSATADGFVAVGTAAIDEKQTPVFWYSPDGHTWSEAEVRGAPELVPRAASSIAIADSRHGLAARTPGLYASTDGRTWAPVAGGGPREITAQSGVDEREPGYLVANEHGFAMLTSDPSSNPWAELWISADGQNWSKVEDAELAQQVEPFGPRPLLSSTGDGFVLVVGDQMLRWSDPDDLPGVGAVPTTPSRPPATESPPTAGSVPPPTPSSTRAANVADGDAPRVWVGEDTDGLSMTALIEGRVIYHADQDCFLVQTRRDTFPIVWPHGSTATSNPAGVRLPNGVVIHDGDPVSLGGGYLDIAERFGIPPDCLSSSGEVAVIGSTR